MGFRSIKLWMVLNCLFLIGALVFTTMTLWLVAPTSFNMKGSFLHKVYYSPDVSPIFQGIVLSINSERFDHTGSTLKHLNIRVTQHIPLKYNSITVDQELEKFQGSRKYHTDEYLKVFSNRMAFIAAMQAFANDHSVDPNAWRFFFEDDISLHPSLKPDQAKEILETGLSLASGDGMVYLGLCGPRCAGTKMPLVNGTDAERCSGTCAHAFGFKRWKVARFLSIMGDLEIEGHDPHIESMYFDRTLLAYGLQVHKVWLIGIDLQSPAREGYDHFGILFQDRDAFHSSIKDW